MVWQRSQSLFHTALGVVIAPDEPEEKEEDEDAENGEFDNKASLFNISKCTFLQLGEFLTRVNQKLSNRLSSSRTIPSLLLLFVGAFV